jgi:hypothetical protein
VAAPWTSVQEESVECNANFSKTGWGGALVNFSLLKLLKTCYNGSSVIVRALASTQNEPSHPVERAWAHLLVWPSPQGTGRNQKKCFQGGKGATAPIFGPRFFSSYLKRGRESLSPPKYLVPGQKLVANLPQFAAICRNSPQFAAICRNLPQFAAICRN